MKSHSEQLDELQSLRLQIAKERKLLKVDQEYLNSAPLNLKVSLSHLKQSEQDKELLEAEIVLIETKIDGKKKEYLTLEQELEEKFAAHMEKYSRHEAKLSKLEGDIKISEKKLNAINDESGTRKRYLAEQEKIITHLMEEANDSISDAHEKFSQLERSISSLEVQKSQIESEIQTLLLDKDALETNTALIQENNERVYNEAKTKLTVIREKISETEPRYDQMVEDIERRKGELHAEVEAIDAKREALFNENQELEQKKRRTIPIEDYKL